VGCWRPLLSWKCSGCRGPAPLQARLEAIERNEERVERSLREELGRNRDEAANQGKALRAEVQASLNAFGASVREQMAETSQGQKNQMELFGGQLAALTRGNEESLGNFRQAIETRLTSFESQKPATWSRSEARLPRTRSRCAARRVTPSGHSTTPRMVKILERLEPESFQLRAVTSD